MRHDTTALRRYRCYGTDIGVTATPDQLTALAALPMEPVTAHVLLSDHSTTPATVYTTPTPGLVLQQVNDITRTTVTTEDGKPSISYGTAWKIAHHSLALAQGGLGGSTYPAALQTARDLAGIVDWTSSHQDVYEVVHTAPARERIGSALRAGIDHAGATFLDLVGPTFALDHPRRGDGLSLALHDLIDQILTWGWTPHTLAERITHRLRCSQTPQARHRAFANRLRRIHTPADIAPRAAWCLDCDPGTRLITDTRGWVTACPTCHTRHMR